MNIEKIQKVDGKTNYTFELRYINGVTVDKKTAPLNIKQKNRQRFVVMRLKILQFLVIKNQT
ncbi:TPA: hypothetical protein PB422_002723 [Staphylococcus aureus]|nr:hypothetical protein [Staphylococcus aureus]